MGWRLSLCGERRESVVKLAARLVPKSTEGQITAVLCLTLLVLFATMIALEFAEHDTPMETADSGATLERLRALAPVLDRLDAGSVEAVVSLVSSCHAGYSITRDRFPAERSTHETGQLERSIAQGLGLEDGRVRVTHAHLSRSDFSYRKCRPWEIDLPMEGIVISVQLGPQQWLNAEVHPHEWHLWQKLEWLLRVGVAFVFVGGVAVFFIRRINRPLNQLTAATRRFAEGMQATEVAEDGPADLRRAIRSFNAMQREVAGEIARRTATLAAISHDVRTPLTALRLKAEMVEDPQARAGLIASVERMERVTASALEYLKGESRGEPMRHVDLSALLDSECSEFAELGHAVTFEGEYGIQHACRPDALARAVRNLIDNAVKYAKCATVGVRAVGQGVEIVVRDDGPGIASDDIPLAMEPFERLSRAREDDRGGFGLGLAVARAIAEGHEGQLILKSNHPHGLIATLRLSDSARAADSTTLC
jgi:signal transduction histidine kinase